MQTSQRAQQAEDPYTFGSLDKDCGPLTIVYLFETSDFLLLDVAPFLSLVHRYGITILLTFKQRHKNTLISSVPPRSCRLTVQTVQTVFSLRFLK